MEKLVTLQAVQNAINTLKSKDEKITQRKIRNILGGGSPNAINQLLKQIEAADSAGIWLPAELPTTITQSILNEITNLVFKATEALRSEVKKAQSRESEAIEDFEKSELRADALEKQLQEVMDRATRDRQEAEKSDALAQKEIENLKNSIESLQDERQQLLQTGEKSRTEATKALMRAEAADQSMTKAETRVQELEVQLVKLQEEKFEAERARAVAEQRSTGHAESLSETRKILAELKSDSKNVIDEQKLEIRELQNCKMNLEKSLAVAERGIENLKLRAGTEEQQCD